MAASGCRPPFADDFPLQTTQGRSGNPFWMNIVTKSWTGGYRATEFVAAPAKAGRIVLALALLVVLAGCSSTFADLPAQLGGLPAGTPERSAAPAAYPAVHDMPPPRPNTVLTAEQQKQAEAELAALRARQAQQAAAAQKAQASQ